MSPNPSDSPLILYGTETGTARDCAENFVETLRLCNLHPRLFSFDDFVFEDLSQEKVIIFIIATSGQGQMPSNMRKGWRQMLSKHLPTNFFDNTFFAIAALGDSSYVEYNFAGKKLYRRILALGGKEIIKLSLCDDQHPNGMDEGFESFKKDCITELCQMKDLFPSIETLDESKQLPPKYILRYLEGIEDGETEEMERNENKMISGSERNYVKMRVLKNERVTHIDHFQDTRLITFENATEDYNPGDVAQIQPENFEEVIQMVFDALNFDDEQLDRPFHLEKSDPYVLLPPKHILTYPTTLRICFKKLFDINSIPTRAFFQSLSRISSNEMEKERLQELADYNSLVNANFC
uniref:Flavodoxin-like domain-containing protein n=1 Tax=Panagrolaimus superbus TaxID=310955 RepID=A0A914Z4U8_9BILA